MDMEIKRVVVGDLDTNCYVLDDNDHVLVIDPGSDSNKIMKVIGNKKVDGIVITHHHFDHIGAVDDILRKYDTKMYDINNLVEGNNTIGVFNFQVIFTPGHKEDLITIYFKKYKMMFVGDFIFKDGIGRCDLPGGNVSEMIKSIDKIKEYPKDIIIYPGHGEETTLGYEINNNPYFNNYL